MTSLLDTINSPLQLRQLDRKQLNQLVQELREFLVSSVAKTGGHLASNLGVVELTIALHYVFNTPDDRLVWDVGHQTYPHKILTGRRDKMENLRKPQGIAGFPRRCESEYDTFGTGHSSTSISAALGMAVAAQKAAVAIIGDGAMTAGMAFEALNNAGDMDANLLVVLNDNDMSISNNVGALNNYLAKLLSSSFYGTVKKSGKKVLSAVPPMMEFAKRAEEHVKGMVTPGTLFEEFGFNYIGPIDGHDLDTLIDTLRNIKQLSGPQFLHIVTKKGKGFEPAEDNPNKFHGVGKFDPLSGRAIVGKVADIQVKKTYTQVFGDWLVDMAALDERLIGITPAMCDGSGLNAFAEKYPQRYFDVGIAEQHALTFAAGMACDGLKPVVAIYSTFLQRAYDQLIHDVALQNLPVLLAIDRAGLVGADGPTHAGSFDLSFLRCIPNIVIMAPSDEDECRQMLYTGFQYNGVAAVRYPRGTGTGVSVEQKMQALKIGEAEIKQLSTVTDKTQKIAILSFGSMLTACMEAGTQLNATVVNMRFVKPIDQTMLEKLLNDHTLIVTVEENCVMGGAGSAVMEALQTIQNHSKLSPKPLVRTLCIGLPDYFIEHGVHETMLADCGLTAEGIVKAIHQIF